MITTAAPTRVLAEQGQHLASRLDTPLDQARVAMAWAGDTFGDSLIVASSMADEVLVHLASDVVPGIKVLFIDTGYHFAETLGTAAALAATRPLALLTVRPRRTVAEQDAEEGSALHARDPDRCCALRKVEPLERGLAGHAAWVTGMRRADSATRADIPLVGWDDRRGMVKLNPLAAWTDSDIEAYAEQHHVLLNPLRTAGYASIGCQPCTLPTSPDQDPRSGRWAGRAKTECGLHT